MKWFEIFKTENKIQSNGMWEALEIWTEKGPNIVDMYGWEYPVVSSYSNMEMEPGFSQFPRKKKLHILREFYDFALFHAHSACHVRNILVTYKRGELYRKSTFNRENKNKFS